MGEAIPSGTGPPQFAPLPCGTSGEAVGAGGLAIRPGRCCKGRPVALPAILYGLLQAVDQFAALGCIFGGRASLRLTGDRLKPADALRLLQHGLR